MLFEPVALRFISSHFIAALTVALVATGCSDSAGGSPTGSTGSGGISSTNGGISSTNGGIPSTSGGGAGPAIRDHRR